MNPEALAAHKEQKRLDKIARKEAQASKITEKELTILGDASKINHEDEATGR